MELAIWGQILDVANSVFFCAHTFGKDMISVKPRKCLNINIKYNVIN